MIMIMIMFMITIMIIIITITLIIIRCHFGSSPASIRQHHPPALGFGMLVHVDLQRFFRQGMRSLREAAPAEAPCTFGYPEWPISAILDFLSTDLHLWHPEQLSLAEFQAMQQLEFIFNVTLNTDAKNLAIDKLMLLFHGAD